MHGIREVRQELLNQVFTILILHPAHLSENKNNTNYYKYNITTKSKGLLRIYDLGRAVIYLFIFKALNKK